jgi:hypothetical protein
MIKVDLTSKTFSEGLDMVPEDMQRIHDVITSIIDAIIKKIAISQDIKINKLEIANELITKLSEKEIFILAFAHVEMLLVNNVQKTLGEILEPVNSEEQEEVS